MVHGSMMKIDEAWVQKWSQAEAWRNLGEICNPATQCSFHNAGGDPPWTVTSLDGLGYHGLYSQAVRNVDPLTDGIQLLPAA